MAIRLTLTLIPLGLILPLNFHYPFQFLWAQKSIRCPFTPFTPFSFNNGSPSCNSSRGLLGANASAAGLILAEIGLCYECRWALEHGCYNVQQQV